MRSIARLIVLAGLLFQLVVPPATVTAQAGGFIYGTLSANPTRTAARATEAGFSHIWINVPWRTVNPSPGQFLFLELDQWGQTRPNDLTNAVRVAREHGLRLVLRLDDPPDWAGGTFNRVRPEVVQNYLREAVRYGADVIDIVEIGNEWNLSAEWAWGGTPDPVQAAALVRAGAAGARQGKPGVKVVTPAVSPRPLEPYGDTQFLELMLRNLSGGDFDYVGMHPYIGSYAPEADPTTCTPMCFRLVEEWHAAAARVHGTGVRAFITEMGTLERTPANLGGYEWMELPADLRAEYLVRALQWARTHYPWLVGAMVFNLDFAMVSTQTEEQRAFSLLNPDGSPRPAFTAFQQAYRNGTLARWDYSPLIRDAYAVAFGWESPANELSYWGDVLNANPSQATMLGMLANLEVRIRHDQLTRDWIFDAAWYDVWGYRLGSAPSGWNQLIQNGGLWYATVLRALRVERSYVDVFGRPPTTDELAFWMSLPHNDSRVQSLQAMINNHLQYLGSNRDAWAGLIGDSYRAVFGRNPDPGELQFWLGQPVRTFPALVDNHMQYLAGQWPTIITDSYWSIFGRGPSSGEAAYWQSQAPRTLPSMLQNHLQYLADNPSAYAGVIRDSYLAVFGREPSQGETDFWLGQPIQSFWELVNRHQQYLADAWPGVIDDSYAAVFGRSPSDGERDYWLSQPPRTLVAMLQNHLQYLADNPGAWGGLIDDSYWAVFGRAANEGEMTHWQGQPVRTIHSLITAHREWLASNPEPAPAGDGQILPSTGAPLAVPSSPGLLTAVSANGLISDAGSGLISELGSGVMGQNGASVIGQNGAGVIGQNGAGVIGQNGAGVIGQNGAGVIGQNGAGVIGQNGASVIGQNGAGVVSNNGALGVARP